MNHWLLAIGLALPAVLACAAFAGWLRGGRMRVAMLVAPLPVFLAVVRGSVPGALEVVGWTFTIDVAGSMLMRSAALLWMAAGIFTSPRVLGGSGLRRFGGCWFLTMTGSLGVFAASDVIGFLTMYALASLPAYGLVIHDGTATSQRAGSTYLGCALVGEVLLVSGCVLMMLNSPGHSLLISDAVAALPSSPWKNLTMGMIVVGFALKMGLLPGHFWLPLAHPAAPAAGSAILSGAIIKAGVIGLIRFLPMDTPTPDWGVALAWAGLITALYGVLIGMTQSGVKTILAYSSVSQMGVVAAMIGMGLSAGDRTVGADAAFYAMHHLFAKGALFLAVGLVAATGNCRLWQVFLPCALLALGMAGLPFTGGALAKIASKNVLGSGMASTMAGVSAAGTALLMLHFLRELRRLARRTEKRPASDLLIAFWALSVTGVVVRWAVYVGAGFGQFKDPFAAKTVWVSIIPVAAGTAIFCLVARWNLRFPTVPAGDIAHAFRKLGKPIHDWLNLLAKGDFASRQWTTATSLLVAGALLIAVLVLTQ